MNTLAFYMVANLIIIVMIISQISGKKVVVSTTGTKKKNKSLKTAETDNELSNFKYDGTNKENLLLLVHDLSPLKPTLTELNLYFKMLKKLNTPNALYVKKMKERFEI